MLKNQKTKKILLITYHFPPSLAVGGLRLTGFVKYLSAYGWVPHVLTLHGKYIEVQNNSQAGEFDQIRISRVRPLPTLGDVYLFIKKTLNNWLSRDEKASIDFFLSHSSRSRAPAGHERALDKLKRYLVSLFMALPDWERNWVLPAVVRGIREIRKEKIGVVLTSGPPHSVHLIGLIIKLFVKVRWVADFRDPWMTPFNKQLYPTCRLSNAIEAGLERAVFSNADLVSATTLNLTHLYETVWGDLPGTRIKFLPNGFDEADFHALGRLKKYERFTITYTGSIYLGRDPEPLFQAIKELLAENRLTSGDISIKLIGNCRCIGNRLTAEVAKAHGLGSVVDIFDYVSHKEALAIIKQSHVALLMAPNQPYQIPAKVYDYMATGTKILALTGKGATADIINSTGVGRAFSPDDIPGIKSYIDRLHTTGTDAEDGINTSCERYARSYTVKELARELDGWASPLP